MKFYILLLLSQNYDDNVFYAIVNNGFLFIVYIWKYIVASRGFILLKLCVQILMKFICNSANQQIMIKPFINIFLENAFCFVVFLYICKCVLC